VQRTGHGQIIGVRAFSGQQFDVFDALWALSDSELHHRSPLFGVDPD
jgi:hypothetical protein